MYVYSRPYVVILRRVVLVKSQFTTSEKLRHATSGVRDCP